MIDFSILDSNRFGRSIFRGMLESIEIDKLKQSIEANKVDILILRIPSETKATHHLLLQLPWQVIHCDNLVYYHCSLNDTIAPLRNVLRFEEITEQNLYTLQALVPVVFKDYQNHYFSNPTLDKNKILEGYIEWAMSYTTTQHPERISWLVYKEDEAIAFATCSFNSQNSTCEGVLYGVHPNHAGRGVYSDLIRYTQQFFKEKGYKKMFVSTQIQNYSVQKVWTREGFLLKYALDTYHINSFLSNPDRV